MLHRSILQCLDIFYIRNNFDGNVFFSAQHAHWIVADLSNFFLVFFFCPPSLDFGFYSHVKQTKKHSSFSIQKTPFPFNLFHIVFNPHVKHPYVVSSHLSRNVLMCDSVYIVVNNLSLTMHLNWRRGGGVMKMLKPCALRA